MKMPTKYSFGLLLCLLFACSSISKAQTIYKKDPGFFTGLNSYYSNITYFAVGPAIGYRFGRHFDISLHPQFVYVRGLHSIGEKHLSVLNFGLVAGYTTRLSDRWQIRAQASLYKIFQFDADKYSTNFNEGNFNSGLASLLFYFKIPVGNIVTLFPNAGFLIGYGSETGSYTDNNFYRYFPAPPITNHFQGIISGGRIGFDVLVKAFSSFYFTISPHIRYIQQTRADEIIDPKLTIKINF